MAKSKDHSEVEYLRSQIRNLKKENKHLKKEISRQNKKAHLYQDLEEKVASEMIEEEQEEELQIINTKDKCPKCSSELEVTDMGIRSLYMCECGYRKSKKK